MHDGRARIVGTGQHRPRFEVLELAHVRRVFAVEFRFREPALFGQLHHRL